MGISVPGFLSKLRASKWTTFPMRCWKIPLCKLLCPQSPAKQWSRRETVLERKGEAYWLHHKSHSRLREKDVPCLSPNLCNKALQQGLSQTHWHIFPLSRVSSLLAASALLISIKRFKWMLLLKPWTLFRLTLNEPVKGDGRWTKRQCAWQKDPLSIPLIVLNDASVCVKPILNLSSQLTK